MLNVAAKEFVPAAGPRCGAASATAATDAPPISPSSSKIVDGCPNAVDPSGAKGLGSGATATKQHHHQQLSPKAPAFVPRGGAVAEARSGDPLASQPSNSTVSSSVVSRDGRTLEEDEDEQPAPAAASSPALSAPAPAGPYDVYGDGPVVDGSEWGMFAAEGDELGCDDGAGVYDAYVYGVYDNYYTDCVGSTVYYDSAYDTTYGGPYDAYQQQQQAAYYWDGSAAGAVAYVYGNEYDNTAECGGGCWVPDGAVPPPPPPPPLSQPSSQPRGAEAALPAGGASGTGELALEDEGEGEEQFLSDLEGVAAGGRLSAADASELLGLFFPHYAGEALTRLWERMEGDLAAVFAELAAMERQVAAERAAASAAGGAGPSGRQQQQQQGRPAGGGRGRGGQAAAAVSAKPGAPGGKRGGGVPFKLGDLAAFPSLSPATSPQLPAKLKAAARGQSQSGVATAAAAQGDAAEDARQETEQPAASPVPVPSTDAAPSPSAVAPREDSEPAEENGTAAETPVGQQPQPQPQPALSPSPCPGGSTGAAGAKKPNFAELLRGGSAAAGTATATQGQGATANGAAARGPAATARRDRGAERGPAKGRAPAGAVPAAGGGPVVVPRVSTGSAVSRQYEEERREAAMLARARNQYFQQATLAYLSGNKALARELGRKGREANEAMKAAHAAAARRIFAQRNAGQAQGQQQQQQQAGRPRAAKAQQQQQQQQPPQQQQGGRTRAAKAAHANGGAAGPESNGNGHVVGGANGNCDSNGHASSASTNRGSSDTASSDALFVDLHGLHVAEAVAALEAQIEMARAAGYRYVRVCTGTGSHTKGARTPARLPAAVADTLLANHLTFKTLQPGLLEAQL